MILRFSALLLCLVLSVLACGPFSALPKQKLSLAVQPTLSSADMLEKAKPIEQFLESRLPEVDVEIYVPLSQAGVIEALRFGQAQIAFMSAWPAQLATDLAGADLALAEVREVIIDGKKVEAPSYYSSWVVLKESAVKTLPETKGKRACFPSAISTSGYVAPIGRMVELGVLSKPENGSADATKFFSEVRFGGGYQQCWEALKAGQVDVSVIAGDVSEKLYNEVLAATRAIESQGPIPSHGVVISKELKEPLRSRAISAVQDLGTQKDLMRGFISSIFVRFEPTTAEKHLGSLRGYLSRAGLSFTERVGK